MVQQLWPSLEACHPHVPPRPVELSYLHYFYLNLGNWPHQILADVYLNPSKLCKQNIYTRLQACFVLVKYSFAKINGSSRMTRWGIHLPQTWTSLELAFFYESPFRKRMNGSPVIYIYKFELSTSLWWDVETGSAWWSKIQIYRSAFLPLPGSCITFLKTSVYKVNIYNNK